MPYGVPFDSEDSVASRRPKPLHTLVSARNNTMHTTVSEANAVFMRLASCCTVNGAKPRRYSEGMSFAMRTRNPDKLKNNSAVPAHISTTDAVNWGDRSCAMPAHGGTFSVDGSQAGFTATVTLPLAP